MSSTTENENIHFWDEITDVHYQSSFYNVESFLQGKSTLKQIDTDGLGNVAGKHLLHLQCHFGLDTLSLARMGAHVVGVDYSKRSIDRAIQLQNQLGLKANFLCQSIYDLPGFLNEKFDIIFSSYGVIHWLQDIKGWAQVISHFLDKNGFFYLVDFHPFFNMLDATGSKMEHPYFSYNNPREIQHKQSYVDPNSNFIGKTYEFHYSISEIVESLLGVGLELVSLKEIPYIESNLLPYLREAEMGKYVLSAFKFPMPLMFSIKVLKR